MARGGRDTKFFGPYATLSALAISLLAPIAAAVTTAVVAYFAHALSKRRERLARLATAAATFRQAFSAELAQLEAGAQFNGDVRQLLRAAYDAHARAVAEFQHFIPAKSRARLIADWRRHCFDEDSFGSPIEPREIGFEPAELAFLHYSREYDLENPDSRRQLAAARIRGLVAYAPYR